MRLPFACLRMRVIVAWQHVVVKQKMDTPCSARALVLE